MLALREHDVENNLVSLLEKVFCKQRAKNEHHCLLLRQQVINIDKGNTQVFRDLRRAEGDGY